MFTPQQQLLTPDFCLLSSVFCLLSSVFCLLSSVFCPLSSVFCLLSSDFCLLSSVFCLPPFSTAPSPATQPQVKTLSPAASTPPKTINVHCVAPCTDQPKSQASKRISSAV